MARGHVQFRHELVQVLGREWLSEDLADLECLQIGISWDTLW